MTGAADGWPRGTQSTMTLTPRPWPRRAGRRSRPGFRKPGRRRCSPRCRSRSRPSATGRTATARSRPPRANHPDLGRPRRRGGRPFIYGVGGYGAWPGTSTFQERAASRCCEAAGTVIQDRGGPSDNRHSDTTAADPQHDPGSPRPAPLVAVPYPPGSRARHCLGPRWPVHHDRQLGNQQAHPARHAAPDHDGGRLDRHRLPHRRGDRGAGVREAIRQHRPAETIRVDSGGLPGRHRPDRPYPQGHQLDRLPLRDAGHRRHGHRRRVLGDQLGD